MARSSRRPESTRYTPTVTSAVLICLSVALALLAQIRLKDELNRLDRDISRLDRQIIDQKKMNQKLLSDYQFLVSSSGLANRVREMQLSLVMPSDDARVLLQEPWTEPPIPASDPQAGAPAGPNPTALSYSPAQPVMARQRR